MAEPRLNLDDTSLVDRQASEGVPEVVEADRPEIRRVAGGDVPPPKRRTVEMAANRAREDEIVGTGEVLPLTEASEHHRYGGNHRNDADSVAFRGDDLLVGVVAVHAERLPLEINVTPAERNELAAAQTREGGGQVERAVLLRRCGSYERPDLFSRVEVVGRRVVVHAQTLDVRGGVGQKAVLPPSPLEDAVQDREELDRLPALAVLGQPLAPPPLDPLRRHVLER